MIKTLSEKEKMLSGLYYDASDSELVNLRLLARENVAMFMSIPAENKNGRAAVINRLLGSTRENFHIESGFQCDYGINIHIGNNFYANFNCVILDCASVTIGDDCMLGPQVGIYTATHPIDPIERKDGKEFAKPIFIGNNCWVGGHAVINPGVTLGNNVVVSSGSVVTKSFGDNVVVVGNPAKVIKHIM
ncbi:sugar O-acetyltransferase [Plesiomonas sp.]|uniref:sugar O-acetyltransferase n=1 Tax=Plesiomonas sp. TaxID=2486279 RepID=UPI003F2FB14B